MPRKQFRPIPRLTKYEIARFWSNVDVRSSNECWLWRGTTVSGTVKDYGRIGIRYITYRASRVAFFIMHGHDPGPLWICHNCPRGANPACCNPAHIYKGTASDNARDTYREGKGNFQHPQFEYAKGEKHYAHKLTEQQVKEIRARHEKGEHTGPNRTRALAAEFGVSRITIQAIVKGKTWKHI